MSGSRVHDPRLPGNTALGAVRKCGSGRSLGRDRQASGVRGCVGLLADSDLTPTRERRHRRCARRRRALNRQHQCRWGTTTRPQQGAQGRSRAGLLRSGRVSSRTLFAKYLRLYAAINISCCDHRSNLLYHLLSAKIRWRSCRGCRVRAARAGTPNAGTTPWCRWRVGG